METVQKQSTPLKYLLLFHTHTHTHPHTHLIAQPRQRRVPLGGDRLELPMHLGHAVSDLFGDRGRGDLVGERVNP